MPSKTCPKCSCKHGPRKLVCDCGHDFKCKRPVSKTGFGTYPEPGTWVKEKLPGFPDIDPPETPPAGVMTMEEVQHYVRQEGLGFCVYSLIDPARIGNFRLAKLWKDARFAMRDIISYLEKQEENKGDE